MKMLFALIVLASFAQAQPEPLQFHGISLGQPASAYIDCSTGKLLKGGRSFKVLKNICAGAEESLVLNVKMVGKFGNHAEDRDSVIFNSDKISSIDLSMHEQTMANVLADMTAKLGRKPDNTDPQVLQNAYGAKWSFGKAVWSGDIAVTVEEIVENGSVPPVAHGVAVIITDTKNLPVEQRASSLE